MEEKEGNMMVCEDDHKMMEGYKIVETIFGKLELVIF